MLGVWGITMGGGHRYGLRRRFAAALLLLAAGPGALAFGCRADSAASATVEFWAMGREGEVVQRLLPEFERRTPGVRVRVQQIPWSAAHEKLLTAYVGEAMPDVLQVGSTWIPELAALGALDLLDERIARSASVRREGYFPGVFDANVIDGRTFAIPWYVDTRLLFYRTDLLQQAGYAEPPRTWEEWVESMARIRARGAPAHYAVLLPFTEWQVPVILALQLDAALLRDGERFGNFRSEPFRRAFELYLSLYGRGLAPQAGEAQVANLYQEFANGYFAFYVSGPWNIGEFARRLPAGMDGRWSTAPMPAPDANYPGISVAGGASLAVSRGSQRKEAAWKLVEYLSEPATQVEFYRLTGDLPPAEAAWHDPSLADNAHARAFRRQLERVRSTPKIPEWERIASKISQHAEAAIRGSVTADEALAALDRDVDEILEKRRWMLGKKSGRGAEAGAVR